MSYSLRNAVRGGARHTRHPMRLPAMSGVLQNDAPTMIVDNAPFFDLIQGSKAAEAGQVIVQAAISYARGLSGAVDIIH